jgi:hypothetical protein
LDRVLELAAHLKADLPLQQSLNAFTARLSPSNCLEALRVSHKLSLEALRTAAESMVRIHFDQVRTYSGFLALPEELVRSMLADDNLGVTTEESAFEAATLWISSQKPAVPPERARELLLLVRYPSLPRHYVTDCVLTHPLLQKLPGGPAALMLPYYLDAYYGPPNPRCTPRLGVAPPTFCQGLPPSPSKSPGSAKRVRRRSSRSRTSHEPPAVL